MCFFFLMNGDNEVDKDNFLVTQIKMIKGKKWLSSTDNNVYVSSVFLLLLFFSIIQVKLHCFFFLSFFFCQLFQLHILVLNFNYSCNFLVPLAPSPPLPPPSPVSQEIVSYNIFTYYLQLGLSLSYMSFFSPFFFLFFLQML